MTAERLTRAQCEARAVEIAQIGMATALYAPLEEAVEKAVRAGGPSRDVIRRRLLEMRGIEVAAS